MPLSRPELTYFQDAVGMVRFHFRGANAEIMIPSQPYGTVEHAEEGWKSIIEALGIPLDSRPSYDVVYEVAGDARDVGGTPSGYGDRPDLNQRHPAAAPDPSQVAPGREEEAAVAADPTTAGEPVPGDPTHVRGEGFGPTR